jgi:hypothetical protein
MTQRNLAPGLILIALGAFLFMVQTTGIGAEAIVAVIGAGFLIAYAVTRQYGFLVPGGIMTGLGLGIVWETELTSEGGAVLIGLGLGFLSIWVLDLIMKHTEVPWWPIIPGGILATIGVLIEAGGEGLLADVAQLWPVALIVIGGVLLLAQLNARRPEPTGPDTTPVGPPGMTAPPPSEQPREP